MSSGYSFDAESVRRISRGIRRIEGMPDQVQGFGSAPVSGPGGAQVRTPATLPANYDGTQPLFGKLIDRDRDGNVIELTAAYILGANNIRLESATEYLGRMERVYNGPDGSAVLYRVQSVPGKDGFFARCHPWRLQEVYFDEEYGPDYGSFWEHIYTDSYASWYDNGTWNYWENLISANFFYPPWPNRDLPIFSLSDSALNLNFTNPNGSIPASDKIKREACYARLASLNNAIGTPTFSAWFQKSKLYFKKTSGEKVYLNVSVYADAGGWGYRPYEYIQGLPFSVFGITKVSTYDGRRFAVLSDMAKDKYGTRFPYYIWFEDPFGLVKSNSGPMTPKRVLVTPASGPGLLAGSAIGGFGYGAAAINSYALTGAYSGPAYIVTNSSDQSLLTTTPVV